VNEVATGAPGAKDRDYWWTVLAVDPLALPLVRLLAARRWLTPNQTTILSLLVGVLVGPAYALGRGGLIGGAVLFYASFVLDCVDGKLARTLHAFSRKGPALDRLADGARRGSASLGLASYLWRSGAQARVWWALVFGLLSFYFMEISGAAKGPPATGVRRKWSQVLARRRLLPTPGMPDVSAIVFVLGPITGLVVPALAVGIVMVALAILLTMWRTLHD
jgi:phosphatidylglycerophosphate synthase